jgi:hypothetical protein
MVSSIVGHRLALAGGWVSYSFMVGYRPARGLYTLLTDSNLVGPLQGFPPIATNPLGNTTISVAIGGYYCTETVIWLQFVCLLKHKIGVALFICSVATC